MKVSKVAAPFALLLTVVPAGSIAPGDGGGSVMPASARPDGYSLDDMTLKMAMFQASGNNPTYYPQTPFQVVYIDFAKTPPPSDAACPAPNGDWSSIHWNQFLYGSVGNTVLRAGVQSRRLSAGIATVSMPATARRPLLLRRHPGGRPGSGGDRGWADNETR